MKKRDELWRFAKYCIVGGMNTMLTLLVIFICKGLLDCNPYLSNALGYGAGLVNSFLWNRRWVFGSHGGYTSEAVRFLLGFALCYVIQLLFVLGVNSSPLGAHEFDLGLTVISGYGLATIAGNVLYTICNFLYNRLVTFR